VAALEAHIHAAPWTAANFREALAAGYRARVGEREGRIVAYGVLMLAPGEAQLLNLSVVPDARRGGLGSALLIQFLADARSLGADQVFLEVRASNAPAIALYERAGFASIARRESYYRWRRRRTREDAGHATWTWNLTGLRALRRRRAAWRRAMTSWSNSDDADVAASRHRRRKAARSLRTLGAGRSRVARTSASLRSGAGTTGRRSAAARADCRIVMG
jgi:ribosomal-protein-alanine acetyltransferase